MFFNAAAAQATGVTGIREARCEKAVIIVGHNIKYLAGKNHGTEWLVPGGKTLSRR